MLFDKLKIRDVELRNRIVVSPMCQYSARDGEVTDWHLVHLGKFAQGGAGIVFVEATAVEKRGRITHGDTGIWDDSHISGLSRISKFIKSQGAIPAIQLAHAGRKASANRPWEGDDHIPADDPRAWEPIAPSAVPYGGGLARMPRAMTRDDIARVQHDYVAAARRARAAGFEWLELHFAHGYLAQSFFSPHSNRRDDEYGGSIENRIRFVTETFAAVREAWPENLPLTARLGVVEFDGREETLDESIELVRRLKAIGLDLIDVSVGFSIPGAAIPWGPGFMAPIAERVRREAAIPAATTWYISDPKQADALIREGKVDLVMLGRRLLENPHWPYEAARALGVENAAWTLPAPYAHWLERYRAA